MLYFNTLIVCIRELVRSSLLMWEAVGILYGSDDFGVDKYDAVWASSIKLGSKWCWPVSAARYVKQNPAPAPKAAARRRRLWWRFDKRRDLQGVVTETASGHVPVGTAGSGPSPSDDDSKMAGNQERLSNRDGTAATTTGTRVVTRPQALRAAGLRGDSPDESPDTPVLTKRFPSTFNRTGSTRPNAGSRKKSRKHFTWQGSVLENAPPAAHGGFTSDTGQHGVWTIQNVHHDLQNLQAEDHTRIRLSQTPQPGSAGRKNSLRLNLPAGAGSRTPPDDVTSGMRRSRSAGRLAQQPSRAIDRDHQHLPDGEDARMVHRARARFQHDQGSNHIDIHGRVEALLADNTPDGSPVPGAQQRFGPRPNYSPPGESRRPAVAAQSGSRHSSSRASGNALRALSEQQSAVWSAVPASATAQSQTVSSIAPAIVPPSSSDIALGRTSAVNVGTAAGLDVGLHTVGSRPDQSSLLMGSDAIPLQLLRRPSDSQADMSRVQELYGSLSSAQGPAQ